MAGTDFFRETCSREAIRLPVQAPVPGSGMPTNSRMPINSYFRIFCDLSPSARSLSQSDSRFIQPILQCSIQFRIFSMNSRINGIGRILPTMQTPIAFHIGICSSAAAAIPPRSSRIGIIEIIKIISIGGSPPSIPTIFFASPPLFSSAASSTGKNISKFVMICASVFLFNRILLSHKTPRSSSNFRKNTLFAQISQRRFAKSGNIPKMAQSGIRFLDEMHKSGSGCFLFFRNYAKIISGVILYHFASGKDTENYGFCCDGFIQKIRR